MGQRDLDTKEKIIKAAEELFAELGINATSIRSIVKLANVNLAAIHYHFGSKESLLFEILENHFSKLNKERLDQLKKLKEKNESLSTEEILSAFIKPVFSQLHSKQNKNFIKIIGRIYGEASNEFKQKMFLLFKEVITVFSNELLKSNPHKNIENIKLNLFFTVGAMVHSTINLPNFQNNKEQGFNIMGTNNQILQELISFCTAGFKANV